jgi:tetratricopeptide (TPR) repeat protein
MADEIRPCLSPTEILACLEGTLPPGRKAQIDLHIDECRLCADAIEGVASLESREGFLASTDALQARVRARTAQLATAAAAPRRLALRFRPAPRLVALAATVVAGVGTAIVLTRSGPAEGLFRQNFEPYPSTHPVVRGNGATGRPAAMTLYESGDYQGALAQLEETLRRDPNDPVTRFYAGVCRLAIGQTRDAVLDLEQVLRLGHEDLRPPAEWYLALAHLRANDPAKARTGLGRIAASEGFYRDRAKALLPELDRLEKRN